MVLGQKWTNFNTNNAFARELGRPDGGGNFITYIVDPNKSYHGKWDDDDGNGRFPVLISRALISPIVSMNITISLCIIKDNFL